MDKKDLHYERPVFLDQVMPHGELNLDKGAHACWYYAMLATKNQLRVGRGPEDQIITYDAENNERAQFENKNYVAIAKSVAIIYGFETPAEFLNYEDMVRREGRRLGIEFSDEIFDPLKIIIN